MYHCFVQGGRDGKGGGVRVTVPATMAEQTKTRRSTNKAHGKLTGVNLVRVYFGKLNHPGN